MTNRADTRAQQRRKPPLPVSFPMAAAPDRARGLVNLFWNAVTEDDGHSVNVGYLCLFWIIAVVIGVIPLMSTAAIAAIAVRPENTAAILESWGKGVGAACVGLGAALGAVGVFLWGDRRPSQAPVLQQTTTTTVSAGSAQAGSLGVK